MPVFPTTRLHAELAVDLALGWPRYQGLLRVSPDTTPGNPRSLDRVSTCQPRAEEAEQPDPAAQPAAGRDRGRRVHRCCCT